MSLLGRSFKRTFREIWREEEEEGSAMAPAKPGKARKGQADEAWRLLEWSTVEGQTSAAAEKEEERRGARKEAAEERGQMKREETLRKLLNTAE